MRSRNLISSLQKGSNIDTEVSIIIENSEKEFEILHVSNLPDKKVLVCKLIEKTPLPIDSLENEEERKLREAEEAALLEENIKEETPIKEN